MFGVIGMLRPDHLLKACWISLFDFEDRPNQIAINLHAQCSATSIFHTSSDSRHSIANPEVTITVINQIEVPKRQHRHHSRHARRSGLLFFPWPTALETMRSVSTFSPAGTMSVAATSATMGKARPSAGHRSSASNQSRIGLSARISARTSLTAAMPRAIASAIKRFRPSPEAVAQNCWREGDGCDRSPIARFRAPYSPGGQWRIR
jgi:hypothetical protein